jgi:hypothetical protein
MFAVVNRLTFTDPVDRPVTALFADEAIPRLREAGCREAHVVQTGERELMLVIVFENAEQAAAVTESVGSPWMRERVVALLGAPTDRRTGPVVASTLA